MTESIFQRANRLLQNGLPVGSKVIDIQASLKLLGFMPHNYMRQCDDKMGKDTQMGIKALNWFVFGRENDITVPYDKITDLLLNKNVDWGKTPIAEEPEVENKKIQEYLKGKKEHIISTYSVPFDFVYAILWQETGLRHYDLDGFLFVGCDTGNPNYKYRSWGYGVGQYTMQNHPPDKEQQRNILDPIKNIEFTIKHLQLKFKTYCDRTKTCQYGIDDKRHLRDCKNCVEQSARATVTLPEANYHPKAVKGYKDMPMLDKCGWPLAAERYNGAGANAVAYKYECLSKIEGKEIR